MNQKRVAIIDDELRHMVYYQNAIESYGHSVTVFADPDNFLNELRSGVKRFDVFVCDIMMPSGQAYTGAETENGLLTGLCIAADIRRVDSSAPIVLMTDLNIDGAMDRVHSFMTGYANVQLLPKSAHPPDLLAQKLNSILSGKPVPGRKVRSKPTPKNMVAVLVAVIAAVSSIAVALIARPPAAPSHSIGQEVAGIPSAIKGEVRSQLGLNVSEPITAERLREVAQINLIQQPVGDAEMKWITSSGSLLPGLTSLFLDGTQITDEAIRQLAGASESPSSIKELDLSHTGVTDESISAIAAPSSRLRQLSRLWLVDVKTITDKSVIALTQSGTGLQNQRFHLNLSGTSVTAAGVAAIQQAHPTWEIKTN